MMNNVLCNLLGLPPDTKSTLGVKQTRKTQTDKRKGIYGTSLDHVGAIEVQKRGALHIHLAQWGGLSPKLLQQCVTSERLIEAVREALDSMYSVNLPREWHIAHLLNKVEKQMQQEQETNATKDFFPTEWHIADLSNKAEKQTQQEQKTHATKDFFGPAPGLICPKQGEPFLCCIKCKRQLHDHRFTCNQGQSGQFYCRMCKPSDTLDKTKPVGLKEDPLSDIGVAAVELPNEEFSTNLERKPIVWELERPVLEPLPPVITDDKNEDELQQEFISNLVSALTN